MKLFDLHCDTVTKMYKGQGSFVSNDLGVSLENYSKYDKKAQIFAIWSNSESTDDEAYLEFMHMADFFRELTEENSNEVVLCTDREQLSDSEDRLCAILAVEDARLLSGNCWRSTFLRPVRSCISILYLPWWIGINLPCTPISCPVLPCLLWNWMKTEKLKSGRKMDGWRIF